MARIAGVNIPTNKRVEIALTYIHGIGHTRAKEICGKLNIPSERRVNELTDAEVIHIRDASHAEVHRLTAPARVVRGHLTYPGVDAQIP